MPDIPSTTRSAPLETTIVREATAHFRRGRPVPHWVGVLTPLGGLATGAIRLDADETIIGRERDPGSPDYDESVSRRHARISRRGDEFVLDDLGSFNGTHVDGVPVISCVLFDGDTVQFGQTLYHFGRILESAGPVREGQP